MVDGLDKGLTIVNNMVSYFGHGITHGSIGAQDLVVFLAIPLAEGRKLLGDGGEEANDDPDRC